MKKYYHLHEEYLATLKSEIMMEIDKNHEVALRGCGKSTASSEL